MPPTPIPTAHGIATIKYLRGGASSEDVVTIGYHFTAAQSADQDAADIEGYWIGAFTAASTLNSYTHTGVHVLRNNAGALEAGDAVVSIAGTVSAAAAAPAIAVRVTKKTHLAGVKFRGRMYLPPAFVSEANIDASGVIDSATLTSIQSHANSFLSAFNGGSPPAAGKAVIIHQDGSAPTEITSLKVRTSVGTQRRRQALL